MCIYYAVKQWCELCVSLCLFFYRHAYIIPGFSLQFRYGLYILFTFGEVSEKLLQVFSKLEKAEIFYCILRT